MIQKTCQSYQVFSKVKKQKKLKKKEMKLFIIVALCIAATLALPVDESQQNLQDESPLAVELEPTQDIDESFDRVKRHYGGG